LGLGYGIGFRVRP